ncbi:hypothetical protein GCM10009430_36630 [Aquimarina litoralis]|uniref:HEAT repeat domain-containing protein n=1 Tax=Aquimarina litoralis TaxID=584605 RepID=A0ABP3U9Q2_9FLAO
MKNENAQTLDKMRRFGCIPFNDPWPNYVKKFNLTNVHIKELTEVIDSSNLSLVTNRCSEEEFFPMHAWRALAQLKSKECVPVLLKALLATVNKDAFWYRIELPNMLKVIGSESIKSIEVFLKKEIDWDYKVILIKGLVEIAINEPKQKNLIWSIIHNVLKDYKNNDLSFNASVLNEVFKLRPFESNLIKTIIDENKIDLDFIDKKELQSFIKESKMYE